MAKKSKTTVKAETQKYYKGLKVLSRYDEQIQEPKDIKRATRKILNQIKNQYYKARKLLSNQGVVDLPNINTLASYYDERQTLPPQEPIDTGADTIQGLRDHLTDIFEEWRVNETENYQDYFNRNIEPKYYEAITKLDAIVSTAGSEDKAADYIKAQPDYEAVLGTDYFAMLYDVADYFDMTLEFMDAIMTDILIALS